MDTTLNTYIYRFRRACEVAARHAKGQSRLGTLSEFPSGQCGKVAHLLAHYLVTEAGVAKERIRIVGEAWRGGMSHGWIELDGEIIDITNDQFDDVDEPSYLTCDRNWHSSFSEGERYEFEPIDSDEFSGEALMETFEFIAKYLNAEADCS